MTKRQQGRVATCAMRTISGSVVGAILLLAPLSVAAQQEPEPFEPSDVEKSEVEATIEWPVSGNPIGSTPNLHLVFSNEIQNDGTFDSDDDDNELNDLFATIEPFVALNITPELSIESGLVLEPIKDPGPGDSRAFEDHGLYAETLGIVFATDEFSVHGGKFNPTFGVAWDLAPGIYGVDFAEDYLSKVESELP